MRGEHRLACSTPIERQGSSPHARGALERGRHRRNWRGIIPACAGSTPQGCVAYGRAWDHPRMRGEHPELADTPLAKLGSSPHARGAPRRQGGALPRGGIIPACAGSTDHYSTSQPNLWDHPRMRGEHPGHLDKSWYVQGSSPHARGAPRGHERCRPRAGIIPACAGSTVAMTSNRPSRWDHPRMRGEHT